jgi:lipoprotein signal peptidase
MTREQHHAILRALPGLFGALLLFVVDRILKNYAQYSLPPEGVFWIPNLLGLEKYANTGIAFSLPAHRNLVLIATGIILFGVITHVLKERLSTRNIVALGFLVFGAASNFYDRLTLGAVIDYLRIGPLSLVNIADGLVVVGIILLMFQRPKQPRQGDVHAHHHHDHGHVEKPAP